MNALTDLLNYSISVGSNSPILQVADVEVFPSSVCDAAYKVLPSYSLKWPQGIDKSTFLCAGKPEGGVDSCQVCTAS